MRNYVITGSTSPIAFDLLGNLNYGKLVLIKRNRIKIVDKGGMNYSTKIDGLTDISGLESAFKQIQYDFPIHGFIHIAGTAYDDLLTNMDLDEYNKMVAVNQTAPILLSKMVIRNMLHFGVHGNLVYVTSICTEKGYKGLSMYASTKGAIEAFSKNIAQEYGSRNIVSNCVSPGFMNTRMTSKLHPELQAKIITRNAMKKEVTPYSVAQAIHFFLTSKGITGQTIKVDNGTN